MSRKPLIAGNWKMNLNHFEAIALVQKIAFSLPEKYYAKVDVTVGMAEDSTQLTIRDNGRGASASTDGKGHGLRAMQERVTASGGSLSSGPVAAGTIRCPRYGACMRASAEAENNNSAASSSRRCTATAQGQASRTASPQCQP